MDIVTDISRDKLLGLKLMTFQLVPSFYAISFSTGIRISLMKHFVAIGIHYPVFCATI